MIETERYVFRRCATRVPESNKKMPFPSDLSIETALGWTTGDKVPLYSPSALDKVESCERKWGLNAVDRIPRRQTKAQELGEDLHKQLEEWLKHGKPPTSKMLNDSGALQMFPLPGDPTLSIEQVFVIEVADKEAKEEDIPYVYLWGFKDVEKKGEMVLDLKTTKSFDWQKTEDELKTNIQSNIYGLDAMLNYARTDIPLRWVYVRTAGAPAAQPTNVQLFLPATLNVVVPLIPRAQQMEKWKRHARETHGRDKSARGELYSIQHLKPNQSACGDFGGCEHAHLCTDLKAGTAFRAKIKQENTRQERHEAKKEPTMGLLDKARSAAASAPRNIIPEAANVGGIEKQSPAEVKQGAVLPPAAASPQAVAPQTPPPATPTAQAAPESTSTPAAPQAAAPAPNAAQTPAQAAPPTSPTSPAPPSPAPTTAATPGKPVSLLEKVAADKAAKLAAAASAPLPTGVNSADAKPPPPLPSEAPPAEAEPAPQAEAAVEPAPTEPKQRKPRAPKAPTASSAGDEGFTLLIDCMVFRGAMARGVGEIIQAAGGAANLNEYLSTHPQTGVIQVSSKTGQDVVDTLAMHAAQVFCAP